MTVGILRCVACLLAGFHAANVLSESSPGISELAWIAGTWEGVGPDDYTGKEKVLSEWTMPVEKTMSWAFRYTTPENGHVHYAFTVLEETKAGVYARGIHHGRDYQSFEKAAWVFKLMSVGPAEAHFECVKNCRVKAVFFELTDEGVLLERYQLLEPDLPDSIFKYRRLD